MIISNDPDLWKKLRELFPSIPKECSRLVLVFERDAVVSAEADFYPECSCEEGKRKT